MTNYTEKNLMRGEKFLYSANIHWSIFIKGTVMLLIGIILYSSAGPIYQFIGKIILALAAIRLLNDVIVKFTSEFAITSKRVIAKFGFIRRVTSELNHNSVESLNIDQGILGRMLDYGTITINGTGGHSTPIPNISGPLQFRTKAMELIDSSREK